jgi:hypothetical protein
MLPVIAKLAKMLPTLSSIKATQAARLAGRLGISAAKVTPASLTTLIRQNKVAAAFVAYEVYGAGSDIVREMAASDAELARIIETLSFSPDVVKDTENVNQIGNFADEFSVITRAADQIGGVDALLNLRAALALDNSHYQLYLQVRDMKDLF